MKGYVVENGYMGYLDGKYVLFADDIKTICTTKKADPPFSIVVIILMGIFFIELVISAIVVEDYFLGFYFWLDFVSLISMVLDIHWFYDWMINSISGGGSGVKKAKTIGAIAKAGKSAKIAARAIRILRVLRIIRYHYLIVKMIIVLIIYH